MFYNTVMFHLFKVLNRFPVGVVVLDRPPDKSAYWKTIFFLIQNICCGNLKEPSRSDCSFKHPKHMFKLMGKK